MWVWIVPLTAEVVPSPADAHLVRVADRHVRSQKVTLVVFVVQVSSPYDVAELFGRDLQTQDVSCKLETEMIEIKFVLICNTKVLKVVGL